MSISANAWRLLTLLLLLLLAACTTAEAAPLPVVATEVPIPPTSAPIEPMPALQASVTPTATQEPTPLPTATALPTPTIDPAVTPTPTPRPDGTPPRVGLQVGHLRSNELPDEQAHLRRSTGARWGNVTEAQLNLDIVNRIKPLLEARGVVVDIIPATVPPGYDADAFLAIHADGSTRSGPRGWKLATPWRTSAASKLLLERVAASYGPITGLPEDVGGVTVNMKGYYAFNWRRHTHAIAATTPAIIVEMGFMTNAADRAVMFNDPDRIARAIAEGVLDYLARRDPRDGAALLPPNYPVLRALEGGVAIRSAPRDQAKLLVRVGPDVQIIPFDKVDTWYQAFVRMKDRRIIGWVRADQVRATDEQPTFPTPTNP